MSPCLIIQFYDIDLWHCHQLWIKNTTMSSIFHRINVAFSIFVTYINFVCRTLSVSKLWSNLFAPNIIQCAYKRLYACSFILSFGIFHPVSMVTYTKQLYSSLNEKCSLVHCNVYSGSVPITVDKYLFWMGSFTLFQQGKKFTIYGDISVPWWYWVINCSQSYPHTFVTYSIACCKGMSEWYQHLKYYTILSHWTTRITYTNGRFLTFNVVKT